jgi:hypothetical protein
MSEKFSIVCPIRDETHLIPITLPSMYSVSPSEVILCLDKGTPKQVTDTIHETAKKCGAENITHLLYVDRNPEYRFHQAWVRRSGFNKARNDIILTLDIDTVLNPKVKNFINLVGKDNIRLVSFSKFSYPISFRKSIAWIIQRLYYHESFTGLYAFSKQAWLETEDVSSLKKIPRGEDTHLHKWLTRKYKALFVAGIKNVDFRPKETAKYQYLMGWNRWRIRKVPLWRIVPSAFLYFRPYLLVGYLKARIRN